MTNQTIPAIGQTVTARWRFIPGPDGKTPTATRAERNQDHVSATGRVVAVNGDLLTVQDGSATVDVRASWLD